MKFLSTVTGILFIIIVGYIIGGFIVGDSAVWQRGFVLLGIDITVGCVSQYLYDRSIIREIKEFERQEKEEEEREVKKEEQRQESILEFDNVYLEVKRSNGVFAGARYQDTAWLYLLKRCLLMEYAPGPRSVQSVEGRYADEIGGCPVIVYRLNYDRSRICENMFIYLVKTDSETVRMFTLETDRTPMLCEFTGSGHINYGDCEIHEVNERLASVLCEES